MQHWVDKPRLILQGSLNLSFAALREERTLAETEEGTHFLQPWSMSVVVPGEDEEEEVVNLYLHGMVQE